MIYGKIWCVVKPTVGVPLFLGSVALTSLFVHYQLLQSTGWLKTYYMGKTKTAMIDATTTPMAAAPPTEILVAAAPKK